MSQVIDDILSESNGSFQGSPNGRGTTESTKSADAFLSNTSAGSRELGRIRFAAIILIGFGVILVPFAGTPLPEIWPFIPIYESALALSDLITCVLLAAQIPFLRSRSLLILALGYLFTSLMQVPHLLSFPGAFSPTGLMGSGPQTTAWLYMFWHAGFPAAVIAYAGLKRGRRREEVSLADPTRAILIGIVSVVALAFALTLVTTWGHDLLPPVMIGNTKSVATLAGFEAVWGLSIVALLALWIKRPHSVLDLWLMVAMCAWICDGGLSAVFNVGRFDLGFYAGRVFGLLASNFVLITLLVGTSTLYRRLAQSLSATAAAEAALRRAGEARLRTLLDNLPQRIIFKDSNSVYVFANESYARDLGVNADELVGKDDYSFYSRELADKYRADDCRVLDSGRTDDLEETYVMANAERIVQRIKVPVSDRDGRTIGLLAIFWDITQRKQIEAELHRYRQGLEQMVAERTNALEVANAQLDAANKELEAFSYSVSHDLRTPLRAIDGFSGILIEDYIDKLDCEGQRLLHVVRDNTKRMSQLIDDILAFSRTGRQEIKFTEVDMEGLASDAVASVRPALAGRVVTFLIGSLPKIQGDPAMLRLVFTNLIDNAVKYSAPTASAVIEIGARASGSEIVFSVKDNGVGFDMQYVGKLFGVFQRLHGLEEFSGTGIGLAIVKRIVSRHRGRVWAEGWPGKGACFYFTIPIVEASNG
jgi:PAS domain S-box-containing protein